MRSTRLSLSAVDADALASVVAAPRSFRTAVGRLMLPALPAWASGLPVYGDSAEGPASAWYVAWLTAAGYKVHNDTTASAPISTNETVMIAPTWLLDRWGVQGAKGFWNRGITPPRSLVQHMVMLTWPSKTARKMLMHVAGWWRYEVDKLVADPFYMRTCDRSRYVALAPGLAMRMGLSTMRAAFATLHLLGRLLRRTPVWPAQSCSDRILPRRADCFRGVCMARSMNDLWNDTLECHPAQQAFKGSFANEATAACSALGIYRPQLRHALEHYHADAALEPSASNTLWYEEYRETIARFPPGAIERARVGVMTDASVLVSAMRALSPSTSSCAASAGRRGEMACFAAAAPASPVVWIGKPVSFRASEGMPQDLRAIWRDSLLAMRCGAFGYGNRASSVAKRRLLQRPRRVLESLSPAHV